jgi:hypothetical protein
MLVAGNLSIDNNLHLISNLTFNIFSHSLVLTLVVPYDHIDVGSALLHMWTYVGAPKCRAIVAIGATAGLSVAMFGSMFPMPRVRRKILSCHSCVI